MTTGVRIHPDCRSPRVYLRPVTARETLPDVDLVVLDLMLPGAYGMDLLKQLREHSVVPVLVLSARNDTADKVRALKLGADDYLTKPFWPEELLERVRARLRRPTMARERVVTVGPLRLDLEGREVSLNGVAVDLTPVEFAESSRPSRSGRAPR